MQDSLKRIEEAAEGLFYLSEADYPFQLVSIENTDGVLDRTLLSLTGKEEGTPLEKVDLPYFFRNQVRVYAGATAEQLARAQRFQQLQQVLQEELSGIEVYCIGRVDIDAFVVGRLKNGQYAGLRTRLIET